MEFPSNAESRINEKPFTLLYPTKEMIERSVVLTVDVGLSGVRIAPFFRRLLVLVVTFPLIAVLLVFGSRINAPSFGEFASLGVERLVQHFHGFLRVRLAEQATWYARGHRRAGQHCEVNFATDRSCQHLEDFLCFDKFQQPTREGTHSVSRSSFLRLLIKARASAFLGLRRSGVIFYSEPNLPTCRFLRSRAFGVPRRTVPPIFRPISSDFSVKISRKFAAAFSTQSPRENRTSLVLTVRPPDSF